MNSIECITRSMLQIIFLAAVVVCSNANWVCAEEFYLTNGDRITGEIVEVAEDTIRVETMTMGVVVVDRAYIEERLPLSEHGIPEPEPLPAPVDMASTEKTPHPTVKEKKIWSGSISGGINARRGNTTSESASSRFEVTREKDLDTVRLYGDLYTASSLGKRTAMKMLGGIRYDHYFEVDRQGWYGLARFEADQDRFAEINQRLVPAIGPGYAFYNLEDFKLMTEIAPGFVQVNYRDSTESRFDAIVIPRLLFQSRIYRRVSFRQEVNAYLSLEESRKYRIRSESILEAPLFEKIKLRLSLVDDYNSQPTKESQKNDLRILSSVAIYL